MFGDGGEGDTGNSYLEEIQVALKEKDERITALENEVDQLRKRESELLSQIKTQDLNRE